MTLRSYASPGTCVQDRCEYEFSTTICPEGCEDGRCLGSCQPTTCAEEHAECGTLGDGCGETLDCGTCPDGQICGERAPNRCGDACSPSSCTDDSPLCTPIEDGCGGTFSCTNVCGGCVALESAPGEPCCAGGIVGVTECAGEELSCSVDDVVYRLALPHNPPDDRAAREGWHDEALFATSIQGIVNRTQPRLFLDAMDHDAIWWSRLTAAGQLLEGVTPVDIDSAVATYETFRCAIEGLVVWDPAVPATLNVATSVAGADDLAIVRFDESPGSLYQRLQSLEEPPAIVVDLRGLFTGEGVIDGTSRPSSGSAKCDAYLWLLEHYLRPGLLEGRHAGYLIDSWWLDHNLGANATQTFNRDFLIARRALVFDLSNWGDEVPIDDPTQPLGTDRATLLELLGALYELHAGSGITQVSGFTPWAWKYTNFDGAGGSHGPVETEWDLARILSAYNALIDGDALGMTTMANASLYSQANLPRRRVAEAAPTLDELRDLGFWDNRLTNPGFEDNNHVGSWTVSLGDYLTITDPVAAHTGVRFLSARASSDVPPNSLSQDVAVELAAGQTARASIWIRALDGPGSVTLALWGLGAEQESNNTSQIISPGDGWQRLEVTLTATAARSSLRVELYLPVGGTGFAIDDAALSIDEQPIGVSPRSYVVWHMGDYDSAAWLYQMTPTRWDDPRRGEVDLAWAFNPNLMDRFALGFDHFINTATPRDHFSGGDTVAGYINLTNLWGARDPSGLADGRSAFEEYARPYLRQLGVTDTIFALNGSSGPFDEDAYELLGRLTPRGVAFNMAGQPSREPFLFDGTPFVGQNSDLVAGDAEESFQRVVATTSSSRPGFNVYRVVLAQPSFMADLTTRLVEERAGRLYSIVSPGVFFRLLALYLGINPSWDATFVEDTLPESAAAGATIPLSVTVRNDGLDTWTVGDYRLGVHVATSAIPARSLPPDPAAYLQRFELPHDVDPGESVVIEGSLTLPASTGFHTAQLDMVEEGITWFEWQGDLPWQATIRLE